MATVTGIPLEALEQEIRSALEADNKESLQASVRVIHPPDLADILERLDAASALKVFRAVPVKAEIEVLHELGTAATSKLFSQLSNEEIASLLNRMPMDNVADVLTRDVPERKEELLNIITASHATQVRDIMQYPPQSAGHLMTEKFVRLQPELGVEEAIAQLRKVDPEVETLTDLYVLNPNEQLIGVVSLRSLITASPARKIEDIMSKHIISVTPETDREEVARLVSRYDFLAMPVLTPQKQMLGIITVDDIIHVLVEEGTEDALKFGAVEPGIINQPYFTVPLWTVIRTRIGWLLLLFLAETLTGSVLRFFEGELQAVVALSFFIPLLIGTGGNTGAQTVSTIIRGIALKEIRPSDIWRVVTRELGSGFLIGLLLGIVAFFRTILWGGLSLQFCLVIGLTILAICTWANTIGAIIPLVAQRLKIDPAVVSAPLITTLVDATGLAIYFLIAKIILGL